jgi:hypothetical protein
MLLVHSTYIHLCTGTSAASAAVLLRDQDICTHRRIISNQTRQAQVLVQEPVQAAQGRTSNTDTRALCPQLVPSDS